MKISAFTMVRNAEKYYFPIKESILSVLPLVDEYIVALGISDENDHTRELIQSIDSKKIKIFDRVWSEEKFIDGKIFADETNFALSKCSGDWCIYLQADEVIHEKDFHHISQCCQTYIDQKNVDGFLFNYHHFWADYDHYLPVHGWYKNDIRMIRNHSNIYSYKDAQSFRKNDNEKLNVIPIPAYIYHYGWVRPPSLMQSKKKEQDSMHHGKENTVKEYKNKANYFNYGALGNIPIFKGTHPLVMKEFMEQMNWKEQLNYGKKNVLNRKKMKHEKLKYKIITFLENTFNGGKDFFGYSNWKIIKPE